MSGPERIQLRRTKGWRKPEGAVVVARPSRYGNPYRVGEQIGGVRRDRLSAVSAFSKGLRGPTWCRPEQMHGYLTRVDLRPLAGRDLACWCAPADLCHGDVLLDVVNPEMPVIDWLVTIGTKSAIVAAPNLTVAVIKVGGHTARPATAAEVSAWNECRDLTLALGKARTVSAKRELLGLTDVENLGADYDVPLFSASGAST